MNMLSTIKTVTQIMPGYNVPEKFAELMRLGLDKAFRRQAETPQEGAKYFTTLTDKKGYRKYQSTLGVGMFKQRRDDEPMPKTEGAMGFGYEYSTTTYANAISTMREVWEKDLYGQLGKEQAELADSTNIGLELNYADAFNRGLGGLAYTDAVTGIGGAPFICEDGLYFISRARPNPLGTAGTWSNRLPDQAWAAGANNDAAFAQIIRDFKLAFRRYKNDRGDLSPKMLNRLIVSPALEDIAKRVTSTQQVYSGSASAEANKFSDQATNTIAGTKVDVYSWLADGLIYAEATGVNELEFLWRAKPETMIYTDGNPDMMNQRVRLDFGMGCGRPCTWMGMLTTGTETL